MSEPPQLPLFLVVPRPRLKYLAGPYYTQQQPECVESRLCRKLGKVSVLRPIFSPPKKENKALCLVYIFFYGRFRLLLWSDGRLSTPHDRLFIVCVYIGKVFIGQKGNKILKKCRLAGAFQRAVRGSINKRLFSFSIFSFLFLFFLCLFPCIIEEEWG